jgi:ABC-type thiamin/hydroxymethylpyrimidine transport system permease subunit
MKEIEPRLTVARAATLWVIYAVVFAVAGGIGAGIPAFLYELVTGEPYEGMLYAIMFAVTGYIGYRLARHVTGW